MKRPFVIVEVMLPTVSGEVGGQVSVDQWTGAVDSVDCQHFDFWCDRRDVPIVLTGGQRAMAEAIVQRTLQADTELGDETELYRGSAASQANTVAAPISDSEKALADYLQNVRPTDAATSEWTGSRARRSG